MHAISLKDRVVIFTFEEGRRHTNDTKCQSVHTSGLTLIKLADSEAGPTG